MSKINTSDFIGALADALAAAGQPVADLSIDGELHRYNPGQQYGNKKPCWYVAHQLSSGHVAASFGDWRSGLSQDWKSWEQTAAGPVDIDSITKEVQQAKTTARKKRDAERARAAIEAQKLWKQLNDSGDSNYLKSKGVNGFGIRYGADRYGKFIAVPMRDESGDMRGLQRIYDQIAQNGSNKLFGPGTWKEGSFHLLADVPDSRTPIYISEGYATAASVQIATKGPAAVCFDAWNALKVFTVLRKKYPENDLIYAGDNDQWTQTGNTGARIAEKVLAMPKCYAVLPDFSGLDTSIKPTDFNDLHRIAGVESVKSQLESYKSAQPSKTWKNKLTATARGNLHCSVANVAKILQFDSAWRGVIGWDEFSLKLVKLRKPPFEISDDGEWCDRDDSKTAVWMSDNYGFQPSTTIVAESVTVAAEQNSFHPVRDYLTSIRWDEKPRLNEWLIAYMGATKNAHHELVGSCWMIGAVARILQPGCKMDNVLMLEGDQGRGKSTALSILGGEWFTDTPFELGSKDGFLAMRGKWIIELAELDSFNRAESTRAKHFFAANTDTYREPYGRRVIDVPRQCVFAGSTNTNEYLKDDTGNRRYWPVNTGAIDKEGIIRDRDQLWAEAVKEFKSGAQWWFDPQIEFVQSEQEHRFVTDAWEELISTYVFEKKKDSAPSAIPFHVSVGEILSDCLGLRPSDWERKHQMRVSSVLKRMKMIRRQIRDKDDNRIWVYMPKFIE